MREKTGSRCTTRCGCGATASGSTQTSARLSDGEQFPSPQPLSHHGTERVPLMRHRKRRAEGRHKRRARRFAVSSGLSARLEPRLSAAMSLAGTTWRSQKGSTVIKDRAPKPPRSAGPQAQPDVFARGDVFATQAPNGAASRHPTCSRRRSAPSPPTCSIRGDPRIGRRGALRLVDRRRYADLGRQRRRRAQAARPRRGGDRARLRQALDDETAQARYDAVMNSPQRDEGAGVPYQVQYSITPEGGAKLWIEDTGRWFAGKEGSRSARTASSMPSTSGTRRRRGCPTCRTSTA